MNHTINKFHFDSYVFICHNRRKNENNHIKQNYWEAMNNID